MEIPAAVAAEASKLAVVHAERRVGYLVHFMRNTSDLLDQIDKLRATRADVQTLVTASQNRDEIVRETVNRWLKKVEEVYAEATVLSNKARLINKWFKGWCFSRFSLGRKVKIMNILIIQRLLDERTSFGDTVSDPKPIQCLPIVANEGFETFASREETTKLILEALKDDNISSVGVFGMPGVGKTWLVKSLASKFKKEKFFDEVVIVTISQNPVLKTIQNQIAEKLDMSLREEEYLSTRAERLAARLNQGKKTLIVLDDVWDVLIFEEIGIPYKNAKKGCKVAFTTRIRDLCGKLKSEREIEVKILSECDAWSLFQKTGGGTFKDSKLAKEIADECKGLPLAISALAAALRGKSDYVLENAVRQLKKSIFRGLDREFAVIRLSYDYLPSEESRICFLLCCLFPEDHKISIDDIVYYVMGEKLFRDVDTLEEARSRLHGVMDEIVSACLLFKVEEEEEKKECVMMHDLIRDVAISIASEEDNGFIVKTGLALTEWPGLDLSKCKRLSLMNNDIRFMFHNSMWKNYTSLPHQIKASHLTALCLNGNMILPDLPSNFFMEMSNLLTLDLSRTRITSLPPSLSYLRSLCTLLMNNCFRLNDISSIETLDKLEILSLRDCEHVLSMECIRRLTNLRFIDLTYNRRLQSFPHKAISNMRQLEEFCAIRSKILGNEAEVEALFQAVAGLRCLTCMEINITTECLFLDVPGDLQNLTKFKVTAGYEGHRVPYKRSMFLCDLKRENKSLANWVVVTLGRTNLLCLRKCDYIQSVVDLNQLGFPNNNMKHLMIADCSQMKYLVCTDGVELAHFTFSHVEELQLNNLDSFERVCKGTVPQEFLISLRVLDVSRCGAMISLIHCSLLGTLQNLEEIEIGNCDNLIHLIEFEGSTSTLSLSTNTMSVHFLSNLTKLFIWHCYNLTYLLPLRVLRGLLNLEELQIKLCDCFVNITTDDTDDPEKDKSILPRLKILKIDALPTLFSIFGDTRLLVDLPSLEVLTVLRCPNLKRLPLTPYSIPKLSHFDTEITWFKKLEWQNESIKYHLQRFLLFP